MGGYGSGRGAREHRRPTTAEVAGIDALALHRGGLLEPGAFPWKALGMTVCREWGDLFLTIRRDGLGEMPRVRVVWTACRFGGRRPWLVCPHCQGRARLLYLHGRGADGGPLLKCRACHGLAYESQRQDKARRQAERAKRLRAKIDPQSAGLLGPFPERPAGMHRATYSRLREASGAALAGWLMGEIEYGRRADALLARKCPGMAADLAR